MLARRARRSLNWPVMTAGLAGGQQGQEPTGRVPVTLGSEPKPRPCRRAWRGQPHTLSLPPRSPAAPVTELCLGAAPCGHSPVMGGKGVQGKGRETLRPTPPWRDAAGRSRKSRWPCRAEEPRGSGAACAPRPGRHSQPFREAPQARTEPTRSRWGQRGEGPGAADPGVAPADGFPGEDALLHTCRRPLHVDRSQWHHRPHRHEACPHAVFSPVLGAAPSCSATLGDGSNGEITSRKKPNAQACENGSTDRMARGPPCPASAGNATQATRSFSPLCACSPATSYAPGAWSLGLRILLARRQRIHKSGVRVMGVD